MTDLRLFFAAWLLAALCVACGGGSGDSGGSSSDDDVEDDDTGTDDDFSDDDQSPDDDDTDDDTDDDDDDDTWSPGDEYIEMLEVDGDVRLRTKVFLPDSVPSSGVPAVMTRTPYRHADSDSNYEARARAFVDDGYAFVLQDCRGRGESEGEFAAYVDEIDDGVATSDWITDQSWSNGAVGTIGASYDAYTALAAAVGNARVRVVIAEEAPNNETGPHKERGTVSKGRLEFLHTLATGDWMSDALITETTNMLDVSGADLAVLGSADPYWQALVQRPNPWDEDWDDRSLLPRVADICAPVLSIFAMELRWRDPIETWTALRTEACATHFDDQRLMVVPEGHGYHTYVFPFLSTKPGELMRDYVDKYLGGYDVDFTTVPRVQYAAPGDVLYWVADEWPPETVADQILHLDHGVSGGILSTAAAADTDPDDVTVDPATDDPCDGDFDSLTYTSEPAGAAYYLAGTVVADLFVSADTADADLFVELFEIPAVGDRVSIALTQSRLRYRDESDSPVDGAMVHWPQDLPPVASKIRAGSRLAIEIRPSHCGFFENPNTGEDLDAQTHRESVTMTVFHDPSHDSRLILPIRP
ncbi:MAG: CocE/NonD family hydrolase [Deltaproteobacteria bacterium]|nr:CocE/NonD family hydrolase [Deltaproteobacteria bacterium]